MRKKNAHTLVVKTDVVPIINVSLVIVLTLMVISPFLNESEMAVQLPEATTSETEDQDKVEIIFTIDGELAVEEEPVSPEMLQATLSGYFQGQSNLTAVLKADQGIPYGEVEKVIAQIQRAGASRIALATEQPGEGGTQ
jgi:biopolymer transport protein TolR